MSLPRELVGAVRRLDEYELRRLQILVRGLLLHADGPVTDAESGDGQPRVHYREQYVRCGKQGCSGCPHGPYWYGYWKEDGRTRKQYVGRHLPGQPLEPVRPDPPADERGSPADGGGPGQATGRSGMGGSH